MREVASIDNQLTWGRSDQLRQLMRQDPTLGKDTDNSLSQYLGRMMRAPDTASNISATNMTSNPLSRCNRELTRMVTRQTIFDKRCTSSRPTIASAEAIDRFSHAGYTSSSPHLNTQILSSRLCRAQLLLGF